MATLSKTIVYPKDDSKLKHRFDRYYCLAILDKHHHPDITLDQGIKLLNLCTDELKRRLPIDFKGMVVKAITTDGIKDIEFDDDKVVKCA